MNRRTLLSILGLAVLAASLAAQNGGEPSEQSVLEEARRRWAETDTRIYVPASPADPTAPLPGQDPSAPRAMSGLTPEEARLAVIDAWVDAFETTREGLLVIRAEQLADRAGEDRVGYAPFHLSFSPGLGVPFGLWDASFSFGLVGDLVRDVEGFQFSSVFSLARDVSGFQGSGVFNIARRLEGFAGAGVFSIVEEDADGFLGSGVFNIVGGRLEGFANAGVFNIAAEAESPLMGAGVFNIVDGAMGGIQLAGLFNIAGKVDGLQIAPLFNVADDMSGLQVGLVNVADNLHGIQLGLINIARNGVNGVGVLYNPADNRVDAFLRNGSRALYTILLAGAPRDDWFERADRGFAQVGLGSRLSLGGRNDPYFDVDLSAALLVGPQLEPAGAALAAWDWAGFGATFGELPWPVARVTLGVPLLGKLHALLGYRWDIDLAATASLPAACKTGTPRSAEPFGIAFTSYGSWFIGMSL
jgi:hypothetical protein